MSQFVAIILPNLPSPNLYKYRVFKVVGNPRGTVTKFFKSWLAKYLIYGEFLYQV